METLDLLRARRSSQWSRVKLLDNDKMSYSVEGKPTLDVGRMTLEYCLTSPVIDREGDLILPDAPDWTDHKRNPLTLFNHKLDQPFGKSEDTTGRYTVERRGDRWYGKSYLFQNDPFAEEVYRLAEKGALNGASIGFLPAKPPFGQSCVKHMNGYDYTVIESCKVFEWSAVYIPMNQDALLVAAEVVRKGLGNKPLSDRAMAMFSPYVPEPMVWANGWTPEVKAAGWEDKKEEKPKDKESKGSGKGQWITIGGGKGEDGKRRGGSPVYIVNGRIAKGHPSLMGKKPSDIKGDAKESSHRSEVAQGKNHAIAKIRKEAKKNGYDPKEVDSLASDIRENHNAFAEERIELMKGARRYVGKYSGKELRDVAGKSDKGRDYTKIVGFDLATEDAVEKYPHHFREENGENGSHYDQMWDMLIEGNPEKMTEEDAYEQALDYVMRDGPKKEELKEDDFDFGANVDDDFLKAFAPTPRSNSFAHKFSGILKMYDDKSADIDTPVDPIANQVEGDAPNTPLGAQLIAGIHEIAMTAAKFYTDNISQLEPELVGEFTRLEKVIMGAIASMAQMFNGRYADLPPLDGADWIDPDGDGDIDVTDDPELNPDAEEDKAIAEDGIKEDVLEGEDATEDGPDATEDEIDAAVDDEVEEESDDEDKPKFGKAFADSAKSKLKVLLDGWMDKQKALKEAAKKIEHPDAILAVKAASHFLRTISGDPREDPAMRKRAKKLRSDLVNTLPKVKAKLSVVVPVAPEAVDIDIEKIASHFKATTKAIEIDTASIQEKLNKLFQLTGK